MTTATDYLYEHASRSVLMEDMAFSDDAPRPGDPLPDFDLPDTDGQRVAKTDFTGRKPLLLIMGSLSCPMTASSNPVLKNLYHRYGSDIAFVTLHVREAHPGEDVDQPDAHEAKMAHAKDLKFRDRLPWRVAVEEPDGQLHRALDEKPNAVFLVNRDGRIVYRGLWAGDDAGLEQALDSVSRGELPRHMESQRRLKPMAMGIGMMREIAHRSGPRAEADLWKAAPPMAAMAWLADIYRPLPPQWRTAAALATVGAAVAVLVTAARQRQH